MEQNKNREFLDLSSTLEFKKMKRLITNYEPLFYFSVVAPILACLCCLKIGIGSQIQHIILGSGTILCFVVLHFALQRFYELYNYVCLVMTLISSMYISEICRIVGVEYYNNCALILFAYSAGICINLSQDWTYSAFCMIGSLVYYFSRLGFHFMDFPVSFITICLVCCLFYIVNIIVFEMSQKQDKVLINKFSHLSLSMCRVIDYLPYSVIIENGKEILFFNSKLVDLLKIPKEEQANHNINMKIEKRMKETKLLHIKSDHENKAVDRLSKAIDKISKAKNMSLSRGFKRNDNFSKNSCLDFNSREEIKGYNCDNIDSSIEKESNKSVSDSENSKEGANSQIEFNLHELFARYTSHKLALNQNVPMFRSNLIKDTKEIDEILKKDEIDIVIEDQKYLVKHKEIQWLEGNAIMHIIEESRNLPIHNINPYLTNDKYKLILRQFGAELKRLLNCIMNDLLEMDKGGRQFKNLRKSMKIMTSMIEEIISIITYGDDEIQAEEKETFNIQELCNEVYSMMSTKIEEKKVDYIQTIAPELENININSEKNTIKQILLNLITNALLDTDRGQLKVECMFAEDDNSCIKVCVNDEGKPMEKEEVKRINKLLSKKDGNTKTLEGSNLIISKVLTEKLGGKIWVSSDLRTGNSVYFTFKVDSEKEDLSFEEDMEISDYNSQKDCVKLVPSMICNNAPFVINKQMMSGSQEDKVCCSNILLVDDNYFNIEVLQSLIEVQLHLVCDSAFNGLEAVNKVKERSAKTCCTKYYKFIFMDVNMPIMDGYVASSEIKKFLKKEAIKNNQNINKIPTKIFAVTAQKEVIENDQKLFDGIILKPISIDGLRNVLGQA